MTIIHMGDRLLMSRNRKLNDQLSWDVAARYVGELGDQPSFFPATVRLLLSDHQRNTGELRPATKLLISYAMRGNKMLSMLYHSSLKLCPGMLDGKKSVRLGDLINLYTPYNLAILYMVYLTYRKCRKLYEKDLKRFYQLTHRFAAESQIGGFVGVAIPSIGLGNGTLAGSLHHLSISLFGINENNQVEEYLTYIHEKSIYWDLHQELEMFGCTSLQIGALLLTKMGFNSTAVDLYWRSLDPEMRFHMAANPNQCSILFGRHWIEGILNNRDQPLETVPGEFYPLEALKTWLKSESNLVLQGSKSWFERDGTDISEEKTPQLFFASQKDQEVPPELRNIFTFKELATMKQEEFDELIDQIDKKIQDGTLDKGLSTSQPDLI